MTERKEEKSDILAKASHRLDRNYHHKSHRVELLSLSPMIKALSLIINGQTMEQGAFPLFLGMNLGLRGIYSSQGSAGIVGKTLEQIIQKLTSGLMDSTLWEPAPNESQQLFFRNLVETGLIGSAILGTLLAGNETEQEDQIQSLRAQIGLLFIGETNVLTHTYRNLLKFCGANGDTKEHIAEILSLCSLLLMLLAIAGKRKNREKILETIKNTAFRSLAKIEHLLTEALNVHGIVGGLESALLVAIQQGKLALETENLTAVLDALKTALEFTGESFEGLVQDLKELESIAYLFSINLTKGLDDKTNIDTGIAVIA